MSESDFREYEYLSSCANEHFFELDEGKRPEYIKVVLASNALRVRFVKADGSDRELYCTLDKTLIPKESQFTPSDGDVPALDSPLVVVYDLVKKAIRSFRCERVTSFDYICPLEYPECGIVVQA